MRNESSILLIGLFYLSFFVKFRFGGQPTPVQIDLSLKLNLVAHAINKNTNNKHKNWLSAIVMIDEISVPDE